MPLDRDVSASVRAVGKTWDRTFDDILTEIQQLRGGKPTAIRLVDAADVFLSEAEIDQGLPADFAKTGGALFFDLLKRAMCKAAAAHDAVCVDILPILNGPKLDQSVDENSTASMQAIADALAATKLPELGF